MILLMLIKCLAQYDLYSMNNFKYCPYNRCAVKNSALQLTTRHVRKILLNGPWVSYLVQIII